MKNVLLIFSVLLSTSLSAIIVNFDGFEAIDADGNRANFSTNNIASWTGSFELSDYSGTGGSNIISYNWNIVTNSGDTYNITESQMPVSANPEDNTDTNSTMHPTSFLNGDKFTLRTNPNGLQYTQLGPNFNFVNQDRSVSSIYFGSDFELYENYFYFGTTSYISMIEGLAEFRFDSITLSIPHLAGSYDGYELTIGSENVSADFNFLVTSVVPEPSTYALILGGLVLGFVAYRRK